VEESEVGPTLVEDDEEEEATWRSCSSEESEDEVEAWSCESRSDEEAPLPPWPRDPAVGVEASVASVEVEALESWEPRVVELRVEPRLRTFLKGLWGDGCCCALWA
jgi:hypothetical protein